MKLALSQIPLVDEIEANDQKALRMICAAAQAGAQLICFPELQLTRFFPQYQGLDASKWAITMESPYVRGICNACPTPG